jgi:hypothetical protein
MRAIRAREKQIAEFESLQNRVVTLLQERGGAGLRNRNGDNENGNVANRFG